MRIRDSFTSPAQPGHVKTLRPPRAWFIAALLCCALLAASAALAECDPEPHEDIKLAAVPTRTIDGKPAVATDVADGWSCELRLLRAANGRVQLSCRRESDLPNEWFEFSDTVLEPVVTP